jgi:outer membrane protein assembly factor BamB
VIIAFRRGFVLLVALAVTWTGPSSLTAEDWPVLGRDATRNAVSPEKGPPTDWDIGEFDRKTWQTSRWIRDKSRNIKWTAPLGSMTFTAPVVANGQIYIGANNSAGYLKRYPSDVDLGCLLCFAESDGKFRWQFSAEKLPIGRVQDWPLQGLGSSPLVEGDRLWFVSNRSELVCLDAQGFRDQENDGPYIDEPVEAPDEADIVWRYDLIKNLGVYPLSAGMGPNRRCSLAPSYKGRIYVVTGNGVSGVNHIEVIAPEAPSLVCFDKTTGNALWTDASPGKNILCTQVADPLVAEIGGRGQVIVPQGDGWLRSFDALTGELIWKFDINPKQSKWILGGRGERNEFFATPVLYKGRIYIGSGQEVEHGEGSGRLVCLDPTKTGDISSELAVDAQGRPIPHRRIQAVNPKLGEKAIPNSNSGLIWEYTKLDCNNNGKIEFEEEFHRTVSNVVIKDDLLIAVDFSGLVHAFDAQSGRRHWAYDLLAATWSSPLIVDDKIYVSDEDGDVMCFNLSADPKQATREVDVGDVPNMRASVFSPPVFANGVLYIATRTHLCAIAAPNDLNNVSERETEDPSGRKGESGDPVQSAARGIAGRVPKPIFAPTPQDVVEAMLRSAGVAKDDLVIDLGSGDGRIVITAAKKHGARGIGYEIDPQLVWSSRDRAQQEGIATLVEIREQEMYTADLSEARLIAVYLYPVVLEKLKPQFAAMKPGAWIVSHHYEIPDATPERELIVKSKATGNDHRVLLYKIPLSNKRATPH